jgi:monoterpene epsilon-lactone hydrolase
MNNCSFPLFNFAVPLLIGFLAPATNAGNPDVTTTISKEAQHAASSIERIEGTFPKATDVEGWKKVWQESEQGQEIEDSIVKSYGVTMKDSSLGGIPVIEIHPRNWQDNGKVLLYTHGGAYTLFSAKTTLTGAIPVADATGLRVISIDYTNPPNAKWQQVTSEVVTVIKALLTEDYNIKNIAIFGDSAGGGLAASSVLKARDEGVGLIGAVVLWSPWSDITETGDTYASLKDDDPLLVYAGVLKNSADAYADPKDQKHPYVSPVYGDYSEGFPPTLIQVGTREIFLSNSVRHYQALDQAGITVKLDPYEGMWHVFQAFHWQLPESELARKKMAMFLREHLNY